jgi:hypothetical protein
VENVQYPADWLANGGPPFEQMGLRTLAGPLIDYAAITLVWDGVWKVVTGEDNTVVGEASLDEALSYLFEYGWRVEDAARKANS